VNSGLLSTQHFMLETNSPSASETRHWTPTYHTRVHCCQEGWLWGDLSLCHQSFASLLHKVAKVHDLNAPDAHYELEQMVHFETPARSNRVQPIINSMPSNLKTSSLVPKLLHSFKSNLKRFERWTKKKLHPITYQPTERRGNTRKN
jgi:hypothetical protein